MTAENWNLVADIGGTNARFAVADPLSGRLRMVRSYGVADFPTFHGAVEQFLADTRAEGRWHPFPEAACLALASPIRGDNIRLTNSHWRVERAAVTELLKGAPVSLINDFEAQGYGVTRLQPRDWVQMCPGEPDCRSPMVVLGPGTGLGVCTVVPVNAGFQVLAGEGGHVDFAPVDPVDIEILRYLSAEFGRVSAERILSGAGMENTYRALAAIRQRQPASPSAAEITAAAVAGTDSLAVETLDVFCRALGSCAGNLALTLGARGGVYIAGGIIPRFLEFFLASEFRARFLAKGRFRDYLAGIPVKLITKSNPGLAGAAIKLTLSEK